MCCCPQYTGKHGGLYQCGASQRRVQVAVQRQRTDGRQHHGNAGKIACMAVVVTIPESGLIYAQVRALTGAACPPGRGRVQWPR